VADEARLIELMIAYQSGELSAFEQLYALLADEVRRYFSRTQGNRSVVPDLVQETFLEMHRSRRTYAPPLPVRPWVFGIARNVSARSFRAAQMRLPTQAMEAEAELPLETLGNAMPLADALDTERAIETLPRSVREPWLLHHAFGFSFESIAARLGITPMAAKLRSSRATKALRVALSVRRGRQR
jgi:RNA polymerase sigma-70 factor, ECF subfamily